MFGPSVFRILDMNSRYGIPATLRLYLREALGSMFLRQDGEDMTFDDCEIPLLIVVTGLSRKSSNHNKQWNFTIIKCHVLAILAKKHAAQGLSKIQAQGCWDAITGVHIQYSEDRRPEHIVTRLPQRCKPSAIAGWDELLILASAPKQCQNRKRKH